MKRFMKNPFLAKGRNPFEKEPEWVYYRVNRENHKEGEKSLKPLQRTNARYLFERLPGTLLMERRCKQGGRNLSETRFLQNEPNYSSKRLLDGRFDDSLFCFIGQNKLPESITAITKFLY